MRKHFLILLMPFIFITCKNIKKSPSSLPSSAQQNVIVLDTIFEIHGLNRNRKIRVFLPKNYQESNQKYPVLYMHDGQNLFDNATSYSGEWGVDESLNQLAASSFNLIVIGIDNGQEKRWNEMSPWKNQKYGKAEGKEYMEFIVKQIKPFVDSTYRTLPNRENTAIMGSSMGGLISHYAIYKYPEVFGKAGIFSPSYWYADEVYNYTLNNPVPKDARLFLGVGKKEGSMVDGSEKMYDYILKSGHPIDNFKLVIDPKGKHNEASWRKQFLPAIKWLFLQ